MRRRGVAHLQEAVREEDGRHRQEGRAGVALRGGVVVRVAKVRHAGHHGPQHQQLPRLLDKLHLWRRKGLLGPTHDKVVVD